MTFFRKLRERRASHEPVSTTQDSTRYKHLPSHALLDSRDVRASRKSVDQTQQLRIPLPEEFEDDAEVLSPIVRRMTAPYRHVPTHAAVDAFRTTASPFGDPRRERTRQLQLHSMKLTLALNKPFPRRFPSSNSSSSSSSIDEVLCASRPCAHSPSCRCLATIASRPSSIRSCGSSLTVPSPRLSSRSSSRRSSLTAVRTIKRSPSLRAVNLMASSDAGDLMTGGNASPARSLKLKRSLSPSTADLEQPDTKHAVCRTFGDGSMLSHITEDPHDFFMKTVETSNNSVVSSSIGH